MPEKDTMKIRLWGVRGSIPCPGPKTVLYGGNTACIELRVGTDDRLIIIDAGSGIRLLGEHIMKNDMQKKGKIDADLFITHTHWDHIMGFPFFIPLFIPSTKLRIHGPVTYEDDTLDKIIGAQLSYRYFPVRHSELAADLNYTQLKECEMDLGGGLRMRTKYLNHPILCLGYRFEYKDKVFCTAYDTEPFRNVFPTDPEDPDYDEFAATEGERAAKEENQKVQEFFQDADLLIHDSQYTQKEYLSSKLGWGHSSFEAAINNAHKAAVKKLLLFHHDPNRSDEDILKLEDLYFPRIKNKTDVDVEFAKEGMEFVL
ncbi:MAG: MBL fold metallo-hydrolase [Spirochaetia bacterium]